MDGGVVQPCPKRERGNTMARDEQSGTLELTDPSQPASEVFFREIAIALEPMEP